MLSIRKALPEDIDRIREIYSYYVENTAISFEFETPSKSEMERRYCEISKNYPYLVALSDGIVSGYAYAHSFIDRPAYRISAEVTIYVDKSSTGLGTGKMLYKELEKELESTDIRNLYALVTYPGWGSIEFHKKMGYRIKGIMDSCGLKNGRYYSVAYMEKIIKK